MIKSDLSLKESPTATVTGEQFTWSIKAPGSNSCQKNLYFFKSEDNMIFRLISNLCPVFPPLIHEFVHSWIYFSL